MLEEFEQIGKEALDDLKKVSHIKDIENFRIKYLGRKGKVTQLLSRIGKLPREEKPKAGQLANRIKNEVTASFEKLKATLLQFRRHSPRAVSFSMLRCRG